MKKTSYERGQDPHFAGRRWRQEHRGDLQGKEHLGADLPPFEAAVRDDGDPGGPSAQGIGEREHRAEEHNGRAAHWENDII